MATYAIGDVQGCFQELMNLLQVIAFDPKQDVLWFTGDLVNRGPDSLSVLRHVRALGDKHIIVLGNHDLHLLAVVHGVANLKPRDTLQALLDASDKDELIHWLLEKPLLHYEATIDTALCHAGIAPMWSIDKALQLANEVATALRTHPHEFLLHMYGNEPSLWRDDLSGWLRLRCITNYLTRMRYCYADGKLNLVNKGALNEKPDDLIPWFELQNRKNAQQKIIFGHWAALGGKSSVPNVYPLDTGCVWGNSLTAMRLEDKKIFSVKSKTHFVNS